MRTTDECQNHADFENLSLRSVTDHLRACARCWQVPGAFHDAPRASAIRSRSLQWVFSTTMGREFRKLIFERPTSDAPVASLVRSSRSRDDGLQLGRDRFPHPPREERAASTTRDAFHRDDAGRPAMPLRAPVSRVDDPAVLPPRLAILRPFARRGLPLWASPRSPTSPERRELLWA